MARKKMTLQKSRQFFTENFKSLGQLWRVTRPQEGKCFYQHEHPADKDCSRSNACLERGEIVMIVGPCVNLMDTHSPLFIQCLTIHGIVWATLDGFRTNV